MKTPIEQFARIGLVHHMLYPACLTDPDDHVRTLLQFIARDDIETFDCCLPYGQARQDQLIPAIRQCGKQDVAFAVHLFPMRKISFASPLAQEQAQARMIIADMIEQAHAIGATAFIFGSGGPAPAQATPAHHAAFADFLRWLAPRLAQRGMSAQLELFDMTIDKCFLHGPTHAAVELIEALKPEVNNLCIELDLAHVPLMGEDFEPAIRTAAPHLARVHLGNCVLRDKAHPRYGDTHPPMGFPGGEIDTPELVRILQTLLEVGFLNQQRRGNLVFEMTPWPGRSVDDTVADAQQRLRAAWAQVPEQCLATAAKD